MTTPKSIEYRLMLTRLSSLIRREELEAMKFMCQDLVPRARLEELETCVQLWVALEERDTLHPDNTDFLETMLSNCCSGRQDVLAVLHAYRKTAVTEGGEDLTEEFDFLVANVGRDWRPLARKLDLCEGEIEEVVERCDRDLREQTRQTLLLWQRNSKSAATKHALVAALKSCQKNMLAYQLENMGR